MNDDDLRYLEPETPVVIEGGDAYGVSDFRGIFVRATDVPIEGTWAEIEVLGGAIVTLPAACLGVLDPSRPRATD